MKIIAGLATFEGREESLKDTINSLKDQVDEIFIYDNSKNIDRKDNGKFFGLTQINEPCYYLTCDDDIIYPEDYVDKMIKDVDKFNCIITHHGRNVSIDDYLSDKERYHFSVRNNDLKSLDVAGTAVTGFNTNYFNPKKLFYSEDFFVSDILFAIKVMKENKKILLTQHSTNWIKQNMNIDFNESISYMESKNENHQNRFKNKLLEIKNGKHNF